MTFENGTGPEESGASNGEDKWQSQVPEFLGHKPGKQCTPEEHKLFKKTVKVVEVAWEVKPEKLAPRVW